MTTMLSEITKNKLWRYFAPTASKHRHIHMGRLLFREFANLHSMNRANVKDTPERCVYFLYIFWRLILFTLRANIDSDWDDSVLPIEIRRAFPRSNNRWIFVLYRLKLIFLPAKQSYRRFLDEGFCENILFCYITYMSMDYFSVFIRWWNLCVRFGLFLFLFVWYKVLHITKSNGGNLIGTVFFPQIIIDL